MRSVQEAVALIACADEHAFAALEGEFADDGRKGVQDALMRARRRIEREQRESARLSQLYGFERACVQKRGGGVVVGLDEVGRGPLAGPVAVGAVVLDPVAPPLTHLNDSKKLKPSVREELSERIKASALAWTVCYSSVEMIDASGITIALKDAFSRAVAEIERQGIHVDVVLLDGNPLGIDEREVNVVKGDATCASIAAASILAKVDRDRLMNELDEVYPGYGFRQNKGYGTSEHRDAIRRLGLSALHRESFCTRLTPSPSMAQ